MHEAGSGDPVRLGHFPSTQYRQKTAVIGLIAADSSAVLLCMIQIFEMAVVEERHGDKRGGSCED